MIEIKTMSNMREWAEEDLNPKQILQMCEVF
jgi:hypothetical protein